MAILLLVAVVTGGGCSSTSPPTPTVTPVTEPPTSLPSPTPTAKPGHLVEIIITNSTGVDVLLWVEAPSVTSDEFSRGLMWRESLPENQGMVFDWEEEVSVPFYMKNTTIPLSIAFISDSGVIVDIQDMEPLSLEIHAPSTPYRYALEVNRGFFEENNIAVGDRLKIDPSRPDKRPL